MSPSDALMVSHGYEEGVGMHVRYLVGTAVTGLAMVAFLAGCGNPGSGPASTGSGGGAGATPGSSNGSATGQTATATGDVKVGMQLFQKNCSMCHSTGSNRIVGPGLANLYSRKSLPNGQAVTDDNVTNWIRSGGGGMPGFPQLSDQQRADLVTYLKTLH